MVLTIYKINNDVRIPCDGIKVTFNVTIVDRDRHLKRAERLGHTGRDYLPT